MTWTTRPDGRMDPFTHQTDGGQTVTDEDVRKSAEAALRLYADLTPVQILQNWSNALGAGSIICGLIERVRVLEATLQLHAGDTRTLSGEVDEWRERALEAQRDLDELRGRA